MENNAKTDVGNYTAAVTDLGNPNYTLTDGEKITHEWSIVPMNFDGTATVTGSKLVDTSEWYTSDAKLVPPDGFLISVDDGETWLAEVPVDAEGENDIPYKLKEIDTGFITAVKTATVKLDTAAPEADGSTNTVGKNDATVTVNASDASSGVASCVVTDAPDGITVTYDPDNPTVFSVSGLEPATDYSFTVKVTDNAGHTTETTVSFTSGNSTQGETDDGTKQRRLIIFSGVPNIPQTIYNVGYTTEAAIDEALKNEIVKISGYTRTNTALYDIEYQESTDGGKTWRDLTPAEYPAGGVTVTLPYPAGVTRAGYTFTAAHMFASADNAGNIEILAVSPQADGLVITLRSLSPVEIAWKKTNTKGVPTGDDAALGILAAASLLSGTALVVTVQSAAGKRKKKKSCN